MSIVKLIIKVFVSITLIILTISYAIDMSMAQQQEDGNVTTPAAGAISKRLKIAVPVKPGFTEFSNMKPDAVTGEPTFGGFSVDVFKAVINTAMPYPVSFDFLPFELSAPNGTLISTYDDMLKAVSSGEFDAAVGDISITYYRTQWVEFTLPHSETGVSMLVRLQSKLGDTKSSFLTRLPEGLIGSAVGVCILNALLLCLLRVRTKRRQGTNNNNQAITSNKSVENIICFLLLVVIATCFTSMILSLVIDQRHNPTIDIDQHIDDFILTKNVGYQQLSFVHNMLKQRGFSKSQLKPYTTIDEMKDLLTKSTKQGGVDVVFGELPYLKLFLTQHCSGYTLVPSATLHGNGFGFAFRKEIFSDLAADISVATLKVRNNVAQMREITERTIGDLESCRELITTGSIDIKWKPTMWILVAGSIGVVVLMIFFYLAHFRII